MDWEFDILYAIQSIRTPFLDKVMAFLSTIGNAGALWIVIGVVLCISKKYRRGGMQMLSAELLSFIVGNLIIKNMVDRLRPCQIDETVSLIVKTVGSVNKSFRFDVPIKDAIRGSER